MARLRGADSCSTHSLLAIASFAHPTQKRQNKTGPGGRRPAALPLLARHPFARGTRAPGGKGGASGRAHAALLIAFPAQASLPGPFRGVHPMRGSLLTAASHQACGTGRPVTHPLPAPLLKGAGLCAQPARQGRLQRADPLQRALAWPFAALTHARGCGATRRAHARMHAGRSRRCHAPRSGRCRAPRAAADGLKEFSLGKLI